MRYRTPSTALRRISLAGAAPLLAPRPPAAARPASPNRPVGSLPPGRSQPAPAPAPAPALPAPPAASALPAPPAASALPAPPAPCPPGPAPGGGPVLDIAGHRVLVGGRDVGLVYLERALLQFLMANAGRAVTRAEIFRSVWGAEPCGATRTVDIHVHRIRRKLGPEHGRRLVTVRRVGYRYEATPVSLGRPGSPTGIASSARRGLLS